jgi:murein DD-endopeptidase MepM/ murein hydrolase activator NlpD
LSDRSNISRVGLLIKKAGKKYLKASHPSARLRYALAFFLLFFCLPVCKAQDSGGITHNFPVITRLDSYDTGFKQYISDVEGNRRRLVNANMRRSRPEEIAEFLTIFQYTVRQSDTLLSLAARCNMPYSALASLNRLNNPQFLEEGKTLLLPSCPGIFIPSNIKSDLEKLTGAARLANQESVELRIPISGRSETFNFFPGADYTPTERAFFLNAGFRFPLRNYRITSAFGIRQNPVTGNISMHQGLDLAAPEGTEVYAVADGVVTETGEDPVYGIYIIITHQNRLTSLYGHLQKIETILHSNVRSGTLIGRVGNTGQSTGPHLHFELRQDGRAVDPSGRFR